VQHKQLQILLYLCSSINLSYSSTCYN